MRGEPTHNVPDPGRYHNAENGHIGPLTGRGDAGSFDWLPTTLEDEVNNDGYTITNRPTGASPRRLYTLGMRGEPGYDDDPTPDGKGGYRNGGSDTGDGSNSWD